MNCSHDSLSIIQLEETRRLYPELLYILSMQTMLTVKVYAAWCTITLEIWFVTYNF
jgi:hypothetical protein